jgi:hypothetical protein
MSVERVGPVLIEIAVLALWLGAAALFSAVVAPVLFAALPTRTLAGVVVGKVLPTIFYSGIIAGAAIIALQMRAGEGWNWRGAEMAGAVMIAACAIAQFVVAPRIERIRQAINGPIDALPINDPQRVAFGRLHGISVGWLGLAMLAAAAAIVLASRAVMSRR